MNEKDFAELAAAAALHALSPEDEQRYLQMLAERPEARTEAAADAEAAAMLALAVDPVRPPPGIRSALLAQIAELPQNVEIPRNVMPPQNVEIPQKADAAGNAESPARPKVRRLTRVLFALAACLALVVGAGIGAVALSNYLNRPAAVVALEEIQGAADAQQATVELDGGGTATAHWSAALGTAVLVTDGIATPADGDTYELWFVRGEEPVSAGIFAVHEGDATAVLDGEMHAGDVIAVTVEQAGGSPSGVPTSDPVVVIPTA